MPEHVLISLMPLALLAAGLAASLALFLSLKAEFQTGRKRLKQELARSQSENRQLKRQIEEVSLRLSDAEERAGVLVAPVPPKSGLNLGKRAQVIRMWRRGDAAETIASSLNLPKTEVQLLLKIHQLSTKSGSVAHQYSEA